MSLVDRVIRLAVEKRPISSGPKDSTDENSNERSRCPNEAATRAAMNPVATAHRTDPRDTSSILPPAIQMSRIWLPGVWTNVVMSDM